MCLKGEGAVAKNREIMGATNPAEAADGTIRKLFAQSIGENTFMALTRKQLKRSCILFRRI